MNYEKTTGKQNKTKPNKLKSAPKNNTGTILGITKKNFQDEQLLHELFLTTRLQTKVMPYQVSVG